MARIKQAEQIRQQAAAAFTTHTCKEAVSRSFNFRRQDGRSVYWFRLTWSPGTLALTGDLGELTLVHGTALARFSDIGWALSADHQYLMSKTDRREVYDPDETFAFVVQHLNEEAIEALNGRRERTFKRSEAGEGAWQTRTTPGHRQELQAWRRETAAAKAAGEAEEDWPERPDEHAFAFWRCADWGTEARLYGRNASLDEIWHVPDHWQAWVRVWRALRGGNYDPERSSERPDFVLLAKNRAELKQEMRDAFGDQSIAGTLLRRMGFDDYYGSYSWPAQSYWQIAAIQHGVRMILAGAAQTATERAA